MGYDAAALSALAILHQPAGSAVVGAVLAKDGASWFDPGSRCGSLCSDNKTAPFGPQTFASGAAVWCNALTSDEGLGLITPQSANRSGLRH
jgi:hypothetical protein